MIPELRLKVDACFLSNPYATDLFLDAPAPRGDPAAASSASCWSSTRRRTG